MAKLKKENSDSRISFMGFANSPLDAVQQFDVGLFPSYYSSESLPTTIIEYLAMHKPTITTDVGECKEMISFGNDLAGIVVELKDGMPDEEEFYKAMIKIKSDRDLYQKMSEVAQNCKSKFDMDQCILNYLRVYND